MIRILCIGCGGFLGAISRYFLGALISVLMVKHLFPFGTLVINVLGCFLLGYINAVAETHHVLPFEVQLLLTVGFLGGFTTFSTFGYEAFYLIKNNYIFLAVLDVMLQTGLGIVAVWLGYVLAR